ncbi:MAG: hypothetical protein OXL96_13335 [Candidatus Poribacteria bacterium]|nr:hypothetical protein [Candidatus Poribacteria bacterium]
MPCLTFFIKASFLLWDVNCNRRLATSKGDHRSIQTLVFSLDRETLVSGCTAGKVQLWDVATAAHLVTLIDDTEEINVVTFSPDGKTLASWNAGGAILLWDWNKIRPDR